MLFHSRPAVIGMIHVGALPGTPRAEAPLGELIVRATSEARALHRAGFDALLIENMHDVPYLNGAVGPEIVAAMTAVGIAVRAAAPIPLGVQVLAAANQEALAVALACGADFVRVENFAYAHVADEGLMPSAAAGPLLRYRRQIGARHVHIFADVKKKHAAHAITADVALEEAARTTAFCGADALIVTGVRTGNAPDRGDLAKLRAATALPLLVGSGVTAENLASFRGLADAFIVGSALKRDGDWSQVLDDARVAAFAAAAAELRR